MQIDQDYPFEPVPDQARRGPVTMGMLWLTMVTAFPCVLIGFDWYKHGLTLTQVLSCSAISCLILLAYAVPASYIGTHTGLGWGALTKSVFGKAGAIFSTINLIWIFIAWYGLSALLLGDGLNSLFHIPLPPAALAVILAILMAFNNFFGFKGVANFARYFAAPIMLAWIGYTFVKALSACPHSAWTMQPTQSFASALATVSAFTIGFASWGNEADYWRFGKKRVAFCAIPLAVSLAIGQLIFPATGWMVAYTSGVTEYSAATAFLNTFSFGGLSLIAALVLTATYFASNDSNLFGCVQGSESLVSIPSKRLVVIIATLGAITAALLAISGAAKGLESVCCLNCVLVPTPTVIMIAEWWLAPRILGRSSLPESAPLLSDIPTVRWPALIALSAGCLVGVTTAAVIPGTEWMKAGIPSIQAWLTALIVYVPLRTIELVSIARKEREAPAYEEVQA